METPKILKALNRSVIIAVVITFLSFILPIVPCKTAPLASSVYAWSMCRLPNPFNPISEVSQKFWLSSTEPMTGLVLQFLIVLVIFTILFVLIKGRSAKVLDLTHKRN